MLIHQKFALSTTSHLLHLLRSSTQAARILTSHSFTSNPLYKFSTNESTKPTKEFPKQAQNDQFIESILSDLSYNEPEEFLTQTSYQTTKEFSQSDLQGETMEFEELLDLLKYIGMSPNSMERLGLTGAQLVKALSIHIEQISIENVTVIVWALGKIGYFSPNILAIAHETIMKNMRHLKNDEVAIIIWSFARINLQSAKFWSEITSYAVEIMKEMSILDLQQIVWGLAKVQYNEDSVWEALEENVQKYLRVLKNEQAISLFMMSFARMKQGSDKFWKILEAKFENSMNTLGHQAFTNSLWALARRNKTILKANTLENVIVKRIDSLKDIEIASISWAFTKLCKGSQEFWAVLNQRISKMLEGPPHTLQLVTLCTCAWVLKSLREINRKDWKMLEEHILAKQQEINTNHLYSILASFAQKGQGSETLWRVLEKRTLLLMKELDEKSLAIVLWCFATAEKGSLALWQAFGENLTNQISKLTEQGLVISLWGFAKTKHNFNPKDFEIILKNIYERLDLLKSVDIGMLMWALGKLKFKSQINQEIVEKVVQKIMSGYEMSLIDFIQSVYALSELKMGTKELWALTEEMIEKHSDEIQEEGWVLLVQAASITREFSEEFWELVEAKVLKNINTYSKASLVGFMNGFNKRNRGSMELWMALEEAIKKDMTQLNENRLAECATILSKRKISQNEFWTELENVLLERLDKMKTSSLARLTHSFGASEQGSLNLWTELQREIKIRLKDDRMINKETLIQILHGFAKKRKGDHQFWNSLEKRLLEEIKKDKVREYELIAMIREFSKVKRGSRELWTKIIELLIANLDYINFYKMMSAIKALDFVKEIDSVEKEMIYGKCLDRVLAAEEDFPDYLDSLSHYKEICAKLNEADLNRLSKKIIYMSKKAVDSSLGDRMKEAFDKISEYKNPFPV